MTTLCAAKPLRMLKDVLVAATLTAKAVGCRVEAAARAARTCADHFMLPIGDSHLVVTVCSTSSKVQMHEPCSHACHTAGKACATQYTQLEKAK